MIIVRALIYILMVIFMAFSVFDYFNYNIPMATLNGVYACLMSLGLLHTRKES
jgi:hypothetical protein